MILINTGFPVAGNSCLSGLVLTVAETETLMGKFKRNNCWRWSQGFWPSSNISIIFNSNSIQVYSIMWSLASYFKHFRLRSIRYEFYCHYIHFTSFPGTFCGWLFRMPSVFTVIVPVSELFPVTVVLMKVWTQTSASFSWPYLCILSFSSEDLLFPVYCASMIAKRKYRDQIAIRNQCYKCVVRFQQWPIPLTLTWKKELQ